MRDEAITPLVTSAEIARLAGVGRAAVSNWRRRYPDFPKPVGGPDSSPTFALAEVEKWLADTGKGEQLRTAGVTATGTQRLDRSGQLTRHLPRHSPAADVVGAADGDDLRPALDFGPDAPSIAEIRARKLRRELHNRRAVFAGMMAALLPEATTGPVLDPACGRGDLLAAAAARFGDAIEVAGQDVDQDAVHAASSRLAAQAPDIVRTVRTANSLTDDDLHAYRRMATAVLCEPPLDQPAWPADELATDPRWVFGLPAPRDGELAWVQHCYELLRQDGTAVVAVSPRTCMQPSGRAIRASMLRAGVLRAVIALPEAAGWGDADVFLWVLRHPIGEPDRAVAMIDLADVDPLDLPTDHAAWRAVFADPTRSHKTPGIELLDEDVALLPSRFVERAPRALAAAYLDAADRLPKLLQQLASGLPQLSQTSARPEFRPVTLHELERAGAVRIHPRAFTPRAGDVLVHAGKRPPTVATGEAGDEDQRTVTNVIEVDPERLNPHFVAAFLHADAAAIPIANTSGSLSRDDLRRCRIPRLPIAQQRRYGKAFRTLAELEAVLRRTTEVSDLVVRTALDGLTSGALAPPD